MKMKKTTKSNLITYGIVIVFYIVMQIMAGTGSLSSLLKGLLVPLCIYSIMAVSLNLTVGILGELSLGHAGFMCVGAFASAFFSMCTKETITNGAIRFVIAILIGALVAAMLDIRLKRALPTIFLGVCIAATIMTAVKFGVISAF